MAGIRPWEVCAAAGQSPRAVGVDQVNSMARDKSAQNSRLPGDIHRESNGVGGALLSRPIGTAWNLENIYAQCPQLRNHKSIARHGGEHLSSALRNRGYQVEQAPLRTPHFAELIEKQNVHVRSAMARTQK